MKVASAAIMALTSGMPKFRVLSVVLFLALLGCATVDAYDIEGELKSICDAFPWLTGCTVHRQCTGDQVRALYD